MTKTEANKLERVLTDHGFHAHIVNSTIHRYEVEAYELIKGRKPFTLKRFDVAHAIAKVYRVGVYIEANNSYPNYLFY